MGPREPLSASLEDYLEAIYHIVAERKAARTKDIAQRLKVNNSSVTGALRALAEREMVNYAPYELITLTPRGKKVAREIVRRHETLREFFVKILSIDPKIADDGACRMEHALPREILDRLIEFVQLVETSPEKIGAWIGRPPRR